MTLTLPSRRHHRGIGLLLVTGLAIFTAQFLAFTALGYYCDSRFWAVGLALLLPGWFIANAAAARWPVSLAREISLAGTAPLLIGLGGYFISEKIVTLPGLAGLLGGLAAVSFFGVPGLLRRLLPVTPGRSWPPPVLAAIAFIAADAWGMLFMEALDADFYRRTVLFPLSWSLTTLLVLAGVTLAIRWAGRKLAPLAVLVYALVLLKILLLPDQRFIWLDNPNRLAPELRATLAARQSAATRPPDIFLIVMDTVRADNVSFCGYAQPTMPKLETWARAAADNFGHAVSPSTWTIPSHLSMFSGLYPSEHEVDWHITPNQGVALPTLADSIPLVTEYLQATGYQTVGICANYAFAFYGRGNSISRGFARFDCSPRIKIGPLCLAYVLPRALIPASKEWRRLSRDAREVTDLALHQLARTPPDQPLFLFLNYMDAHETVWPPEPYRRKFLAADPPIMLDIPFDAAAITPELKHQLTGLYDGALRFLDDELSRLLAHPRAANALIIIVSDHGQAFGEHNQVYHMNRPFEEVAWVPLLIHHPGQQRGQAVAATVSTLLVFETIIRAAGLAEAVPVTPPAAVVSQLHNHPDYDKLTSYADYRDGWKLLRDYPATERLFNLAADPKETFDYASTAPARLAPLQRDLDGFQPITTLTTDPNRTRAFFHSIGYLN